MKAIGVTAFGGPEVLHVFELPGLADGARLNHLALPAIGDGGGMAVIRG